MLTNQTAKPSSTTVLKGIFVLMALCLCFFLAPKAYASDELIGANIQDGVLKGYYGPGGDITIPNTVVQIAPEAFKGNSKVVSVTIPGSVKEIGYNAFEGCTALEAVYFSDPKDGADLTIRVSAFIDCPKLKEITIPACAKYVTANIFKGCTSLEAIKVDEDNPYYFTDDCGVLFGPWVKEGEPQYNDPNLALTAYPCGRAPGSYTIPEKVNGKTVNRVWASGFRTAKNLTGITIPATCTILGGNAFEGTGLTEIVIPETVTSGGACLLEGCTDLTDATLPSSCTELGTSFFDGCTSLQRVNFASRGTLDTIGMYAFRGCTSLTSLVIPSGVKTIVVSAFEDCTNLQRVFIPASVISFPNVDGDALNPFEGCSSDLTVYVVSRSTGEKWATNNAETFGWNYAVVSGLSEVQPGSFSLIDMGKKVKATGEFQLGDSLRVEFVTSGNEYDKFQATAGNGAVRVYRVSLEPSTSSLPASLDLGIGRPSGMTSNAKLYHLSGDSVSLINSTTVSGTLTATVPELGYYAVIDSTVSGGETDPTLAESVSLNRKTASIEAGKSLQLSATVLPSTAANKTVTWSTSNASVATVTNKGVVKGVSAGTANITATTSNGKSASCLVTVTGSSTTPDDGKTAADSAALRAENAMVDGNAAFSLGITNTRRIATVQIAFETDGESVAIVGKNGFSLLGDINGSTQNGTYSGTAVLCYLDGKDAQLTAAAETVIAQFKVSGTNPTLKITSIKISGWDDSGNVAYGTISGGITPSEATFTGEKTYDLNNDGVVDQLDITWAQMYYRADRSDSNWSTAEACDFDGDGAITVADFVDIMMHFTA